MTDPPAPPGYRLTILTLAVIAAMGSMAIHMLVPALPLISADFAIGEARAQQTVSVYLAGLAAGQLVAGPLADRRGRRPVMLTGLGLFIAGALGAALAPALPWLLLARLVQAAGGACGVVAARVMVGDVFGPRRAAGAQASLMTVVLISPAIAPVIGGAIADIAGWRAVFGILAIAGICALFAALRRLPETGVPVGSAVPLNLGSSYLRLVRNRHFLLTTGTLAAASSGLYMFLAAAPFLLVHRFGLSSSQAGVALFLIAVASILGTRLVVPVGRRTNPLIVGTASSACGAAVALLLAVAGMESAVLLVAPVIFLGLGAGLAGPVAFNAIAFTEAGLAATATSLAGALQMFVSASAMALLGLFAPVDPLHVAIAIMAATATALACAVAATLAARGQAR